MLNYICKQSLVQPDGPTNTNIKTDLRLPTPCKTIFPASLPVHEGQSRVRDALHQERFWQQPPQWKPHRIPSPHKVHNHMDENINK